MAAEKSLIHLELSQRHEESSVFGTMVSSSSSSDFKDLSSLSAKVRAMFLDANCNLVALEGQIQDQLSYFSTYLENIGDPIFRDALGQYVRQELALVMRFKRELPSHIDEDRAKLSNIYSQQWVDFRKDVNQIIEAQRAMPVEVPPPATSDLHSVIKLYDRDQSVVDLMAALLSTSGQIITPVFNQCYGAGKTALVYHFRRCFTSLSSNLKVQFTNQQKQLALLQSAVYLHIPFLGQKEQQEIASKQGTDRSNQCRETAIRLISAVLSQSLRKPVLLPHSDGASLYSAISQLSSSLPARATFLFHFDEVGSFEFPMPEVGVYFLCELWDVGMVFKRAGHFFVMTGRSAFLHKLGVQKVLSEKPQNWVSPSVMSPISLPLLSETSIKCMFEDVKDSCSLFQSVSDHPDALTEIRAYTGGVPRAVVAIIGFYQTFRLAMLDLDDHQLHSHVFTQCANQSISLSACDRRVLKYLCEIAWAGFGFPLMTAMYNGELLSSLIARFGLYSTPLSHPQYPYLHRLVVPNFLLTQIDWAPQSLQYISQYISIGDRLETGFSRVLHLRLALDPPAANWTDIGLPALDSLHVPYLEHVLTQVFAFPKFTANGTPAIADAVDFMNKIHSKQKSDIGRVQFSTSLLPDVCNMMQIGQYYQSLPQSSSADALIRLSESAWLKLQFKNLLIPVTLAMVEKEAKNCKLGPGQSSFLLFFCTSGHSIEDGQDKRVTIAFDAESIEVTVILLSKESVQLFLGYSALQRLRSDGTSVENLSNILDMVFDKTPAPFPSESPSDEHDGKVDE